MVYAGTQSSCNPFSYRSLASIYTESLITQFLTPPLPDPQAKCSGLLPESLHAFAQQRCGTGNDLYRPGTWWGTSELLLLTGAGSLQLHEDVSRRRP